MEWGKREVKGVKKKEEGEGGDRMFRMEEFKNIYIYIIKTLTSHLIISSVQPPKPRKTEN